MTQLLALMHIDSLKCFKVYEKVCKNKMIPFTNH